MKRYLAGGMGSGEPERGMGSGEPEREIWGVETGGADGS